MLPLFYSHVKLYLPTNRQVPTYLMYMLLYEHRDSVSFGLDVIVASQGLCLKNTNIITLVCGLKRTYSEEYNNFWKFCDITRAVSEPLSAWVPCSLSTATITEMQF